MVDRDLSCSNSHTTRIYWDVNNIGNHSEHLGKHIMFLIYDFIIVILYLVSVLLFRSQYHLLFILRTTSLKMVTKSGRNM